jgi:2-C-methyl-D-erythritol 4-phosphate cytidylyltransferase
MTNHRWNSLPPPGSNPSPATSSDAVGPTSSPERTVLSTDRQAGSEAPASNAVGPTPSPERTVLSTDRQAGSEAPAINSAGSNVAESGEVWVIVVAGGSGSRYGGPKQFELLAGERVIDWSIAVASLCADGVVVVVSADSDLALTRGEVQEHPKIRAVVHGGASRSASVRNGLAAVPDSAAVIVVHDAARPLASPQLFTLAVQAIRDGAGAAVTAISVVDTIKRTDGSLVVGTVDRSNLVAVQTPQAFNAALLRQAHAAGSDATDDAGLVEALGATVVIVPGDVRNLKLTTPEDLIILEAFAAGQGETK